MSNIVTPAILKRIADAEKQFEEPGSLKFDKYGMAPWSASKLKALEKCPYQFYLKYILKVKPDDDFVQDTFMADVGTSAHKILEYVVLGKSIDDAYAAAKFDHCDVPIERLKKGTANLTQTQWEMSILPLETNIIAFKEKLEAFERNNKIKRMLTELKLGVTKDWKPTTFFGNNVFFRGVIDLIIEIETEPGYAPDGLIIDHKHGGGEFGGGVKNYSQQLDIYKPLYHYGHQKTTGIQAGIHFIKAGHTAYDDYTHASEIETALVKKLEWLIQGAIDTIKETQLYFKHIRGNHCKYCEFDKECKAGSLKENELSTKKYFKIIKSNE
jgi:CRISPR/Cas system-associated exonuclease Cas4 (RecB family)